MSNIFQRSVTGAIYVSLILVAIFVHPVAFKCVSLLINLIALIEFTRIGNKMGIHLPGGSIAINMVVFLLMLIILHTGWNRQLLMLPGLILVLSISLLSLYQKNNNPILSASFSFYGSLLITMPLLLLNFIHEMSLNNAVPYTLAIFIFIWTNDTFAYLAGIALGRHKLFSRISPKKSWEGFIGGIIMTIVAGIFMHHYYPSLKLFHWGLIALITGIASVYGDFIESLLKRIADVKDSGTILPGHGGILDRIDSLLFAAPVVYTYLIIYYSFNK